MNKRSLQIVVGVLAIIPVVTGIIGMWGLNDPIYASTGLTANTLLDSNLRFFSGVWLGLGLDLYWLIPGIERQTVLFRVIWGMIFLGGVGRCISMLFVGPPPIPFVGFAVLEIVGAPVFVLWQARLATNNRSKVVHSHSNHRSELTRAAVITTRGRFGMALINDLDRAVIKLKDGYCLWVGAGVTKQLWQGAPQWGELTRELEALAELAEDSSASYPERLQRCSDKLGREVFRKHLRKIYYTGLCEALLKRTVQWLNDGDGTPSELGKVAGLGRLANPIVSFNIESFSSTLLARPAGPARIIPFIKPQTPRIEFNELTKAFQRIVYHPHGLSTVDCIITEEDYKNLDGTLALKLATHAAFGNHLAIVGMSLEDQYLRDQISEFRNQINSIIWFNDRFGNLEVWARCNRVDMVQGKWSEFWEYWNTTSVPQEGLLIAWYRMVCEAAEELSGGRAYQIAQSIKDDFLRKQALEDSKRIGELGELRLVEGKKPSEIVGQLVELMQANKIRPPASMQSFQGSRS